MKFYIYSQSYNENSGGRLVSHRLCHLLNTIDGCEAYLVHPVPERLSITNLSDFIKDTRAALKWLFKGKFLNIRYNTNPNWVTPAITKFSMKDLDTAIVVYPEVTYGNPLNGKNVVRWFLHQPGNFTQAVNFGINELHYKFNSAIQDFNHCLSVLSNQELKVIYYPLEYYNMDGVSNKDGCCHLIRKGKDKPQCHPENSVLIDGMSHQQIAEVFKKSKRFISYDDYTAYSLFAVLCGCESIVVPGEGITKEQWYSNPTDRYGLAYGFSEEELEWANQTRSKVLEHILNEHQRSFDNVVRFVDEVKAHFKV